MVSIDEKTQTHPCYSGSCKNARMHLPVAPACNVSCNYCNRKFDCVNESRPGVTSEILNPQDALEKYIRVRNSIENLKVVGIAGPGDALANFDAVSQTLKLIRQKDSEVTFCLSTNGLYLPKYAQMLSELGVTHVTITINTIDAEIGAKIYREVLYEGRRYYGTEGAKILIKNQLEGLKMLVALGIVVKINTVLIKGINDTCIEDVSRCVKENGAHIGNIMPLIPAPGSEFEHMPLTSKKELNDIRKQCSLHIKQMYHCQQCRADAIGTLEKDCSSNFLKCTSETTQKTNIDKITDYMKERYLTFAVATSDGRLIDQHFGHTSKFVVYKATANNVQQQHEISIPRFCNGTDECGDNDKNLEYITEALKCCDVIVVQRIGYLPLKHFEGCGIRVFQTCGLINEELIRIAKETILFEKEI